MSSLKEMLGIAPVPASSRNDAFEPSPLARKLAVPAKTDYDHYVYPDARSRAERKILMVCTEQGYLTMQNGKKFATGNHPVEMLVPMLHLRSAGFGFVIATPTGQPVQVEEWALPREDRAVMELYNEIAPRLARPEDLRQVVAQRLFDPNSFSAIFFPGGHGALLGLPEDETVGKLIHWAVDNDKYVLAICHGPAALLAANQGEASSDFAYRGYKMAVFPDAVDRFTPLIGYLPGQLPWFFNKKLEERGVEIVNKLASGTCHHDRKLITGDSPQAANAFGKMAAEALLAEVPANVSN